MLQYIPKNINIAYDFLCSGVYDQILPNISVENPGKYD